MDEIKSLADVLKVLFSAARVAQSKGAFTLEDAALIVKAEDWVKAEDAKYRAQQDAMQQAVNAAGPQQIQRIP